MGALNFAVKAIGGAVRGVDFPTQPVKVAGQSRRLILKSANIRQQSGNQIACVLTISSHSRVNH
jgi:hypothetical protein